MAPQNEASSTTISPHTKYSKKLSNEFPTSLRTPTTFEDEPHFQNNSVLAPYVSRALKTSVHFYQTDLVRKGTSFEAVDTWYLPVSAIWSEFHTLPSTHRHPQRTSVHNNAMLMLAFEMPSNGHRSTLLQCLPDKAHQTTGFSPPLTTAEDFTTLHKPWS